MRFVGLHPDRLAENIALLPAYELDLGQEVGVTTEKGRKIFIHPNTREELKYATYGGFARKIVEAWMGSPGHRANIVDPALGFLGCSVRRGRSVFGADMIFGVQEFYTPGKPPRKKIYRNSALDRPGYQNAATTSRP